MRKKLLAIILILLALALVVSPVTAKDKPDKLHKIGDKLPTVSGFEKVYIGENPVTGAAIWNVKIGEPVYIPNTSVKYDCTWYVSGEGYIIGNNIFDARVDGNKVSVDSPDGQHVEWNPQIYIDSTELKMKDKAKLETVDPINEFMYGNTLSWKYANGITRYLRIIEGVLIEYYVIEKPLDGDLKIITNLEKPPNVDFIGEVVAYDATGKSVEVKDTLHQLVVFAKEKQYKTSNGENITYPVTIDPDVPFYTTAKDATAKGGSFPVPNTFSSARTASTAWSYDDTGLYLYAGQTAFDATTWYNDRAWLYIPTDDIPDSANVTAVDLYMYVGVVAPDVDGKVGAYIVASDTAGIPHDTLEPTDYNYLYYDLGTTHYGYIESLTAGAFNKISTTNNDLTSIIDVDGTTKLTIVNAHDYSNVAPTEGGSYPVFDGARFYAYEKGVGYRPYLEVTYEVEAPDILIQDASQIAVTTARLNAVVLEDGNEDCQVRWGYGTSTNETVAGYDTVTAWSAAEWSTGEHPYLDITGLAEDTTYYFRVAIKNSGSEVESLEETFDTYASLNEPTNIRVYPSSTSASLSFAKGTGSSNTVIVLSTIAYPTTITDGTLVYSDTGSVATIDDLEIGGMYYVSLWGKSGANYSASYATIAFSTTPYAVGTGDTMETPDVWDRWFSDPDYTNLSNLEPIYSGVNDLADGIGMPRGNFWYGGYSFMVALGAAIIYYFTRSMPAMSICVLLLMSLGAAVHLIPVYYIFVAATIFIGGWFLNARGVTDGE